MELCFSWVPKYENRKKKSQKITTYFTKVLKSKCHFIISFFWYAVICIDRSTLLTENAILAAPSYDRKSNICLFCYNPMIVTLFYSEFSYAPSAVRKFQIPFCKICSCGSYCLPILDDVLPCVWTADSVK